MAAEVFEDVLEFVGKSGKHNAVTLRERETVRSYTRNAGKINRLAALTNLEEGVYYADSAEILPVLHILGIQFPAPSGPCGLHHRSVPRG